MLGRKSPDIAPIYSFLPAINEKEKDKENYLFFYFQINNSNKFLKIRACLTFWNKKVLKIIKVMLVCLRSYCVEQETM